MQKRVLLVISLFSILIITYGQQPETDTSGYIQGDLDFNLIYASDKGSKEEVLRLLNLGADVNASLGNGVTSLMYAIQAGHFDIVQVLVLNGADVNLIPDNGITALLNTVFNDTLEIAEYLIRNGADIDLADFNKVTPLIQAVVNGSFYMTDMLLYYGADVDKKDIHGTDALMLASILGLDEIATLLIEYGADVNSFDTKQRTPLHMAVQNGFIDVADTLIRYGAEIDKPDISRFTPLCVAVENNDLEMVHFLVRNGAKVDIKVSGTQNALTIAQYHKNDSVIQFLLQNNTSRILWPSYDKFIIGTEFNWNSKDLMWGFHFGMSDKKYNTELFADYRFRLRAIPVLEKESDFVSYQYRERRGAYSIGLDKKFTIIRSPSLANYGLMIGIKETLTFGSYRGSLNKPDTKLLTVPRLGIYWNYKYMNLKLYYEYLNLNLYGIKNGRINFAFYFNINRKNNSYFPKYIYWL